MNALDSLIDRKWFPSWEIGVETISWQESQALVSSLVNDLRAVPKLTKLVAERLLKQTVEAFNRLDTTHQFICTLEREDICDTLDEIMSAAGFPDLADKLDDWRDW